MKIHHTILAAGLLLAPLAGRAAGQRPLRLVVDRKGVLHVPAPALRALGVRRASNGTICVQFPLSVLAKPAPTRPGHGVVPPDPPRVWPALGKDGSLALGKTRLIPGPEYVPGAPGTTYLATGQKGRLVLQKPAGRR